RRRRRRAPAQPAEASGEGKRHQITASRRLDVSLDPADLTGEEQPRLPAQRKILGQKLRRVDEGVAVDLAEPQKLGPLQSGNLAKNPLLLRPGQTRLETDQVVRATREIFLSELHHRAGSLTGPRIAKPDWLHRAKRQRVVPPLRHHLDRQTPFEVTRLLEIMRG